MTPEVIQAIFGGIVTIIVSVIGAIMAGHQKRINEQEKQIGELRGRIVELEAQVAEERGRFKAAVRVIRGLLAYISELTLVMRTNGQQAPANPVTIPPELEDEI